MTPELENKLIEDFPLLYQELPWGFECNDGWYTLIYEASAKLEAEIQKYIKLYPNDKLIPHCVQLKQKFGTLRIYMAYHLDEFDSIIKEAERLSGKTCELCGKPGELQNRGWIMVRCKECIK